MSGKSSKKTIAAFMLFCAVAFGIWLITKDPVLMWYWLFGLAFGCIMQHFGLCFVTSTSDPFLTGSTAQLRSILIGILVASLGITAIKYLSGGALDFLGVSAISLPLMLGAFIFGIGMTIAGCCTSGMFIRLAEGYAVHLITMMFVIAGYLFANSHYETVWAPFVKKSPVIFLPETFGWLAGVGLHIAIILLLYTAAVRWEKGESVSSLSKYLTGGILLGVFSILHYIILNSGWSITGAFFWIGDIFDLAFDFASGGSDSGLLSSDNAMITALGSNLRNIGMFAGALICAVAFAGFRFRKINSAKQIIKSAAGGSLMGYGACMAGGCNISAFFTAAASLSLSAWVFMIFLLAGVFTGIKLLFKLV